MMVCPPARVGPKYDQEGTKKGTFRTKSDHFATTLEHHPFHHRL